MWDTCTLDIDRCPLSSIYIFLQGFAVSRHVRATPFFSAIEICPSEDEGSPSMPKSEHRRLLLSYNAYKGGCRHLPSAPKHIYLLQNALFATLFPTLAITIVKSIASGGSTTTSPFILSQTFAREPHKKSPRKSPRPAQTFANCFVLLTELSQGHFQDHRDSIFLLETLSIRISLSCPSLPYLICSTLSQI